DDGATWKAIKGPKLPSSETWAAHLAVNPANADHMVIAARTTRLAWSPRDENGGLDVSGLDMAQLGPMLGRVEGMGVWQGLRVTNRLDPTEQPFLNDHRIDGTAVLPGVMGVEAFVEAARLPFPELEVLAVEDVEFGSAFKFYRDEPRDVEVRAWFGLEGEDVVADCQLVGSRQLPGRDAPQETVHFTGRVRLGAASGELSARDPAPAAGGAVLEPADLYRYYFHGPAYQVVGGAWHAAGAVVARLAQALPPNHVPTTRGLATHPRLLELCFQAAGAQEIAASSRMGLPHRIARVRFAAAASDDAHAVVAPRGADAPAEVAVVDSRGRVLVSLEGYETVALPNPLDAPPLRGALLP
ncbi:MAG: polyketide synthase dehydratase domain-containing protein, partial [Myxococcota bacterium]